MVWLWLLLLCIFDFSNAFLLQIHKTRGSNSQKKRTERLGKVSIGRISICFDNFFV